MTKHTPAPWVYSRNSNPICILGDWRGDGSYSDVAEIAPQERQEALANARLISAAPDLLAACHALMRAEAMQEGKRGGEIMGQISLAIDAARAAIAKATGA